MNTHDRAQAIRLRDGHHAVPVLHQALIYLGPRRLGVEDAENLCLPGVWHAALAQPAGFMGDIENFCPPRDKCGSGLNASSEPGSGSLGTRSGRRGLIISADSSEGRIAMTLRVRWHAHHAGLVGHVDHHFVQATAMFCSM